MKILGVVPKQITVGMEFTLEEVRDLKIALDHATFNLDLKVQAHQKADNFIQDNLYPTICDLLKELEGKDA